MFVCEYRHLSLMLYIVKSIEKVICQNENGGKVEKSILAYIMIGAMTFGLLNVAAADDEIPSGKVSFIKKMIYWCEMFTQPASRLSKLNLTRLRQP